MVNIRTTYMGLDLKSPIVVAASPLSEKLENIIEMEKAGAGAVVMFSLFEEQIRRDQIVKSGNLDQLAMDPLESLRYFPEPRDFRMDVDEYLKLIEQASDAVNIPIIGSLNGISRSGWIEYAKLIEDAGASAIEINLFYIPANPDLQGTDVEQHYVDVVRLVKEAVGIPISIKLNPYFSAMANMARKLDEAGADALVLFNRFYQPDFDIDQLTISHHLKLSTADEIRLPLQWLAILYGRVQASLAASTGVTSSHEVIKYILAGADCTMVASVLLKHGIPFLTHILDEVASWMRKKDFAEISEWQGSMSQKNIEFPSLFERANYIKVLKGYRIPTIDNF